MLVVTDGSAHWYGRAVTLFFLRREAAAAAPPRSLAEPIRSAPVHPSRGGR